MNEDIILATWSNWITWLTQLAPTYLSNSSTARNFAIVGAILITTVLLEAFTGKNWRARYQSRNFRIDLVYYLFYYGGLYQILVLAWVYKGLTYLINTYAPWMQLHLFSELSQPLQFLILYLVVDFVHYWNHRWRHSNRFLWAFHSVHHSQTTMTVMTNYRFHIIDETFVRICMFIPFQMLLGVSIPVWLWLDILILWLTLLEHSEWNWNYGRMGRIFVSPVFHRQHHAMDEELQGRNFGGTFSFWDDLFGTAQRKASPQVKCGLLGDPIPETFLGQFLAPFSQLLKADRSLIQPVSLGATHLGPEEKSK